MQTRGYIGFLTDWLVTHRLGLFFASAVISLLAAWPASRLDFDQSIESLYSHDNPRLRDYLESKSLFGGDEFGILAYRDPQLLAPSRSQENPEEKPGKPPAEQDANSTAVAVAVRRLNPAAEVRMRQLAHQLETVPGVIRQSVRTLASETAVARIPFLADREAQAWELARGLLVGDDGETTALIFRLEPAEKTIYRRAATIARIRAVAGEFTATTGIETYLAGEPIQVHDMFRYVENDGAVLGLASSALLMLIILAFFRSLRWVLLPMFVIHATLLWTKAILVLSGMQLSMVSSMLTSLITVIAIAEVMHITVRFQEHRGELGREEALRMTLKELAPCSFWTVTTTASGFAAEMVSSVKPVQSFGIMMSIGSMLILIAGAILIPGGVLLGARSADPKPIPAGAWLDRLLQRLTDWVEHHPRQTSLVCVALTAIALLGMFRLRVETDFSRNFRANSPIVQSLNFIETRLGGAGTWEVNFHAPPHLDDAYLVRIARLTEKLRTLEVNGERPLTKVLAATDAIGMVPRIPLVLPDLASRLKVVQSWQTDFLDNFYNARTGSMRILLRARERQPSDAKLQLIAQVENLVKKEFPEAKATGLFVLLTYLIESLMEDQWLNFFLGSVMIVSLMWIAFRSFRIGLISLVPNLLPIALVVGAMGWLDMPINIATAMIASVTMGLTIDSSIHFLAGLQRAQNSGLDFFQSLRTTHGGVGRALVLANFALIAGFLVLTLSHFIPLVYFGVLVSVAMLGGLLGNLIILPLMLRWGHTRTATTTPVPPADSSPAPATRPDP